MTKHIVNTGNELLDETIHNFVLNGLPPGGFTTALLSNDLFMALARADYWNVSNLKRITDSVTLRLPPQSYGSYDKVNDWINDVDGRRTEYAEKYRSLKIYNKMSDTY